jgi:hypothetical protein
MYFLLLNVDMTNSSDEVIKATIVAGRGQEIGEEGSAMCVFSERCVTLLLPTPTPIGRKLRSTRLSHSRPPATTGVFF